MTPNVIRYRARSPLGALQAVDFSSVGGYNYAFFELQDPARLSEIETLLTAPPLSQEIVSVTYVHGKPVLVARNHASPFTILDALAERGEQFEQLQEHKGFDAWKIRSILGFSGQGLQLVSSFLRPPLTKNPNPTFRDRIDTSVLMFAVSNLAANAINLVYEGEKVEDKHQLRYLKQRVNREIAPHMLQGEQALSIDDNRASLRGGESENQPIEKAQGFLKRHSVQIGELGLRYLGALGLAFPARYWPEAWKTKTLPRMDSSMWRRYTGLSSSVGKTIAFASKIPDPYNPKPHTWLDTFREKSTFLLGGLIEITSFSALAYDCFFHSTGEKNKHRGLLINGKHYRDWLGGVGASLFVLGYIVRSWAKFGEREVNMPELYAHASDTLAATPPEKMPQLLANTAASLTEHFSENERLGFSTIYANLASDLHRYHGMMKKHAAAASDPQPSSSPKPLHGPHPTVEAANAQRSPLFAPTAGLASAR